MDGIRHVSIEQAELGIVDMRIDIKVVDALGIERGGPTLDAPNPISFRQKQLSQIGSILPRHPGYECSLLHEVPCSRKKAECLHAAQIGAMVEEQSIVMLQSLWERYLGRPTQGSKRANIQQLKTEERRVGKEGGGQC